MNLAVNFRSLKRTILISIIVLGLAGGVAFAILQSRQNLLTGNTISTATANLLISNDGVNYSESVPGFDFSNIIPGDLPVPAEGYPVYLKNSGSVPLALKLSIANTPSNPGAADLAKINIALTAVAGEAASQGFTLESLVNGGMPVPGGNLARGETRQYKIQALTADDIEPGAIISNIDFAFVGLARDSNATSD